MIQITVPVEFNGFNSLFFCFPGKCLTHKLRLFDLVDLFPGNLFFPGRGGKDCLTCQVIDKLCVNLLVTPVNRQTGHISCTGQVLPDPPFDPGSSLMLC